jgi:hypothetical protein
MGCFVPESVLSPLMEAGKRFDLAVVTSITTSVREYQVRLAASADSV